MLLASILLGSLLPQMPATLLLPAFGQSTSIDDFESYQSGDLPNRWKFLSTKSREYESLDQYMDEDERFYVQKEDGNQFLRGYTKGEAQRISLSNEQNQLGWMLDENPVLSWRWRANKLPEGASEKGINDTGGAVYVVFKTDWLGRPVSIKYTYSSSLPVGTTVSFGKLKVIVASSALDGVGDWEHVERNVADDYLRVFGKNPPDQPLLITLWSDSDDTRSEAEVDFDDISIRSGE